MIWGHQFITRFWKLLSRRTGMLTLLNMATPFRASMRATSCGVDTITDPSTATSWPNVSWTSPVPGGMSITSASRSPPSDQSTSKRSCCTAFCTMRPRQATAVSGR